MAKNCSDKFSEIKNFVEVMGDYFRPIQVMRINIEDAKWLVEEVERLRRINEELTTINRLNNKLRMVDTLIKMNESGKRGE